MIVNTPSQFVEGAAGQELLKNAIQALQSKPIITPLFWHEYLYQKKLLVSLLLDKKDYTVI